MANLTGTMLTGYGIYDQANRLNNLGNDVVKNTQTLADQATAGTTFKPYTVTSNLGTTGVDQSGGINYNLTPELQQQYQRLLGQSSNLFGQVTQPMAQREQDVYNRIRATQMPEEQRAQLEMEGRLYNQGRDGISSSMYGGTPEQLAYHKAVQEAQNNASLMALQQARADQAQNANLGGMLQQSAFLPGAQMANLFNPSINTSNLQQTGQIAGQNLSSQLGLGGLEAQVNTEKLRSELMAQLYGTLGSAANNSNFDPLGDGWNWLKGQLGI